MLTVEVCIKRCVELCDVLKGFAMLENIVRHDKSTHGVDTVLVNEGVFKIAVLWYREGYEVIEGIETL